MNAYAKKALVSISILAVIATVVLIVVVFFVEARYGPKHRLERLTFFLGVGKVVITGGLASIIGILIPLVFTEARAKFERLKESRLAYSQAKTGIDYLPIRLCTANLSKASQLVQQVHVYKHQAELYDEVAVYLGKRGIHCSVEAWGDQLYEKLFATRSILHKHAENWDKLTPIQRLVLLEEQFPLTKET